MYDLSLGGVETADRSQGCGGLCHCVRMSATRVSCCFLSRGPVRGPLTFLVFFFGLSASSCAKKVKHVAIVPGAVTVVAGESFALSLELRNGDGELINCCDAEYSPEWEIVEDDAPFSYWKSDLKAHVSIWESVTGVYHMKATVNGHSDQVQLTIVAGSPQLAPLAYVAQDWKNQSGTCERSQLGRSGHNGEKSWTGGLSEIWGAA